MNEARRVIGRQHLGSRTSPAASRAAAAISTPAIAAAWRSSQPSPSTASACARPSAPDQGPAPGRSPAAPIPSQPAGQQLGRIELGQRPAARARPPAAARSGTADCRRSPRTRAAHSSSLAPPAEPRRAQSRSRRPRSAAPGAGPPPPPRAPPAAALPSTPGRPGRSATSSASRQPLQPRRQVGQPAQRGLIGPVRIVDGDQQRPRVPPGWPPASTGRATPQTKCRRPAAPASWPDSSGRTARSGPGQQRLALAPPRARQPPLEQLAHHAEREIRLELRAARPQNLVPQLRGPRHASSASDVLPIPPGPRPAAPRRRASSSSSTAASSRSRSRSLPTRPAAASQRADQPGIPNGPGQELVFIVEPLRRAVGSDPAQPCYSGGTRRK